MFRKIKNLIFRRQRRLTKKRLIVGIIILILIIFAGSKIFGNENADGTENKIKQQVELVDLNEYREKTEYVVSSGEVESVDQVELKSEVMARVNRVYVNLGDQVRPGQTLVVFNNADLSAQRQQAQAGYEQALATKQNLEAQYEAQKANHEKIKIASENAVASAESALESAENNLKLNQNTEDSQIVKDAYDSMITTLNTIQNTLTSALVTADNILGVDNALANNAFEEYLSVSNPAALSDAKNSYKRARNAKNELDAKMETITLVSSNYEIDQTIDLAKDAVEKNKTLFSNLSIVVNSTFAIGNLTQTELDILKSNVSTGRSSVSSAYTSLINQIQAISTAKTSLTGVEIAYEKALRDLEDTRAQANADVEASLAALKQMESSIQAQDAAIKNARGQINSVGAAIGKTIIRSPIRGTVAVLPAKTGELMSAGQLVVSIVNKDSLQIKTFVGADEVKRIDVNNEVIIDDEYFGAVTHVAPSIDPATKKVEIIIVIDEEYKDEFIVGQFADVSISKTPRELEDESVFLPLESVKITADGKFVFTVNEEGIVQRHEIEVDRISGNSVEIINGLENLEKIIITAGAVEVGDELEVVE